MIEGFTEEKNDCCCCAAVKPRMTWNELKEFAKKYNCSWVDDDAIEFGYLEFIENGEVMWYGEIICPDRTYEQMAAIIENMFGE